MASNVVSFQSKGGAESPTFPAELSDIRRQVALLAKAVRRLSRNRNGWNYCVVGIEARALQQLAEALSRTAMAEHDQRRQRAEQDER